MKIVKDLDARELAATLLVLAASAVLPNAYVLSGMKLATLSHLVAVAIAPAIAVVVAVSIYTWLTGLKTLARTPSRSRVWPAYSRPPDSTWSDYPAPGPAISRWTRGKKSG